MGYDRFSKSFRFSHQCDHIESSASKESLLHVSKFDKLNLKQWMKQHEHSTVWIRGYSIVQILDISCGNIAHYLGKILFLQHILDNFNIYSNHSSQPPSKVFIVPARQLLKRFMYPKDYQFYHLQFLESIVAPFKVVISSLSSILSSYSSGSTESSSHNVHVLHNLSTDIKQHVCFENAVVPSLLKGRFFVNDREYPSEKPSMESAHRAPSTSTPASAIAHADVEIPSIPRDSLMFRQRVNDYLNLTQSNIQRKKKIILIDRRGQRRVFDQESKERVERLMNDLATSASYEFSVAAFDGLDFKDQVSMMQGVAIAVGIHGANLVNAVYMPPLSVLVEVFPFGFKHGMYEHGGNSGLVYLSHTMVSGDRFDDLDNYQSVQHCIQSSHDCKMHYRDLPLEATEEDIIQLEYILRKAIKWHDSLL